MELKEKMKQLIKEAKSNRYDEQKEPIYKEGYIDGVLDMYNIREENDGKKEE